MYDYYYYYYDWTYLLVIAGVLICLVFSAIMRSTFSRYSGQWAQSGYTGRQTAERILRENGLGFVPVSPIRGSLTDHYDPSSKSLSLSQDVYGVCSIASIGVAAHECGHAIQDQEGYLPLRIRSSLVPVVNICSRLSWVFIVLGLVVTGSSSYAGSIGAYSASDLILNIGILMFSATVLFQLVTLPVEINASHRGLTLLRNLGILSPDEMHGARKVLTAAAFTYVASTLSAILSLLRIILLANNRKRK